MLNHTHYGIQYVVYLPYLGHPSLISYSIEPRARKRCDPAHSVDLVDGRPGHDGDALVTQEGAM